MKPKFLTGALSLVCLFSVAALTVATAKDDPEVPDHNLSEFKLGDHLSGSEVDLSDQKGKVVVIEYWGTR